MPATGTQEDIVPTTRQIQDEARRYYELCREAERLGVPTSLDDPLAPKTVEALERAVVNAQQDEAELRAGTQ